MTNKEQLEQLTGYISHLSELVEHIYEREIYPVSFFSQAFDTTNKIQDSLHQIEIAQIELFEKQMKEHQAQIRFIQNKGGEDESTQAPTGKKQLPELPSIPDNPVEDVPETTSHDEEKKPENNEIKESVTPSVEKKEQVSAPSLDQTFEKKVLSDIKRAFTINDRFRFCRELFSANEGLMNQTFAELNKMESYDESIAYIKACFNWDPEDGVTADFISMIEKRFN